MAKVKKIDKEFVLSDSTVNDYGFRLLTSGWVKEESERNPIGYYMHERDCGVVVRWEDLRSDGDKIYGKPCINLSNERGQQTLDEVEDGFLNAASVGHLVLLEATNDASMMLPGQTGPTITKWFWRECSLVDIGSNYNALTKLYSADGKELKLADLMSGALSSKTNNVENSNSIDMQKLEISLPDLAAAGYTGNDAAGLLAHMKALKLKAETLEATNLKLKGDNAELQIKVDTLEGDKLQDQVETMLGAALKAGKITAPLKLQLASIYAGKPELLKVDLESRNAYTPLGDNITQGDGTGGDANELAALQKMSWDDMHKKPGCLAAVKNKYPNLYSEKYQAKYGRKPTVVSAG